MPMMVSELARLAGVTVRTLHHYDAIGLVRPSARSEAGYRIYGSEDLERLQQVLFFRELGFGLEEIRRLLGAGDFDIGAALRMQRRLLSEKLVRVSALIGTVDTAIEARERGTTMTAKERFEVFGDFDPARYEGEVRDRWGETDAYRESGRRTGRYTKQDWARIKGESDEIFEDLVRVLESGRPADSPEARAVAERHREHVDRWFYPCSRSMHRALGELYVSDPRFGARMERRVKGLAEYARDAWRANAGSERRQRRPGS